MSKEKGTGVGGGGGEKEWQEEAKIYFTLFVPEISFQRDVKHKSSQVTD